MNQPRNNHRPPGLDPQATARAALDGAIMKRLGPLAQRQLDLAMEMYFLRRRLGIVNSILDAVGDDTVKRALNDALVLVTGEEDRHRHLMQCPSRPMPSARNPVCLAACEETEDGALVTLIPPVTMQSFELYGTEFHGADLGEALGKASRYVEQWVGADAKPKITVVPA